MALSAAEQDAAAQDRNGDKITIRLSADARDALEWIAAKYGNISFADAMRRALGTEKYLLEQRDKGSSILVEEVGGRLKEIVLR